LVASVEGLFVQTGSLHKPRVLSCFTVAQVDLRSDQTFGSTRLTLQEDSPPVQNGGELVLGKVADHHNPARRTLRSASKKDLVAPTLSFNKLNACSRVRN
jgi:hypothetical protein